MATTSKEGSRRVNYSVPTRRGSDDKYQCPFVSWVTKVLGNWNDCKIKECKSNNWRASLVPAAAVIPAPRVYTKAVAVKKLVVNFGDVKAKSAPAGGAPRMVKFFGFLPQKVRNISR